MEERRTNRRREECSGCPVATGDFVCRSHAGIVVTGRAGWSLIVAAGLTIIGLLVGTYVRVGEAAEKLAELKMQNTYTLQEVGHLRERVANVERVVQSKDFPCPQGIHEKERKP